MQFQTTILSTGKNTTGIEMPEGDVLARGGGKRPPVRVTVNGYTYRSSVAVMDGRYMLSVSSDVRTGARIAAGDEVDVIVELDTEKREVDVPPELTAALAGDPSAQVAFDALSNSKKQQLTLPISRARAAETKARNVEKALATLRGA